MTIAIRQRGRVIPVERRTLSVPARLKPKPASADILRSIAAELRDMPRECAVDRAELLLWLSRHARQIDAIALDGFEPSAPTSAEPEAARRRPAVPPATPIATAEAVFAKADDATKPAKRRKPRTSTVRSTKGRRVKVEVHPALNPLQTSLFPDLGDRP